MPQKPRYLVLKGAARGRSGMYLGAAVRVPQLMGDVLGRQLTIRR